MSRSFVNGGSLPHRLVSAWNGTGRTEHVHRPRANPATAITKAAPRIPPALVLTDDEQAMAAIFNDAVARLQLSAEGRAVLAGLGDLDSTLDALDWDGWLDALGRIEPYLADRWAKGAQGAVQQFGGASLLVGDTMDLATNWARRFAGDTIVGIDQRTRQATAEIIQLTIRRGYSIDRTAYLLANTVGMTPRYAQALGNFEAGLLAKGTAEPQVRLAVTAYRDRLLVARGRTVARYEVQRAVNAGRLEGWNLAVVAGALAPDATKRLVTGDGCCDYCDALLEPIGLNDSFGDSDMAMPPFHPNCRCTAVIDDFGSTS